MTNDDDEGPDTESTLAYLDALVAFRNGDFPVARDNLKRAIALGLSGEGTENAPLYLSEAYFRTGQDERAVEIIEKILRTSPTTFSDPTTRDVLFPYTDLYWSRHGAQLGAEYGPMAALEYLEEREILLSRVSGMHMPHFHYLLANTYLHLNRRSDAQKELETCVQAEISFPSDDPRRKNFVEIKERAQQKLASFPKSGVGGGCWIASAAYGSGSPITETLRRFRDEMLHQAPGGSEFIEVYYRTSPRIAERMEKFALLRFLLRIGVVLPAYWLARLALRLKSGH
jgi:tetratricopeptide (TPR) repeat protein